MSEKHIIKTAAAIMVGVREYLALTCDQIFGRLKTLEERPPIKGDPGDAGRDGTDGKDGKDGKDGTNGLDGRSVDVEDLQGLLRTIVAELPPPAAGKDGRDGGDGRDGTDGKSVELAEVEALVGKAVSALPLAKDGSDGADGKDGRDGTDGKDGQNGTNGKDADPAHIDALVEQRVQKRLAELLPDLVAKAIEVLMPELAAKAAALVPKPADGRDGEPGRDAVHIDVLDGIAAGKRYQRGTFATHDGGLVHSYRPTDPLLPGSELEKSGWHVIVKGVTEVAVEHGKDLRSIGIAVRLTGGQVVMRTLQLPVVIDRGIFKAGDSYVPGDGVTWNGCFWIAQRSVLPGEKPGDESEAFRLAVKKGTDGRDGLRGDKGERGPKGSEK